MIRGEIAWQELPQIPTPAPALLSNSAEALTEKRLTEGGYFVDLGLVPLQGLQSRVLASPENDYYTHIARWFFSDRRTRTVSPWSTVTVSEHIDRCLSGSANRVLSREEALRYSPGEKRAPPKNS